LRQFPEGLKSFWCFVFLRCLIYKVQASPPNFGFPCHAELHYSSTLFRVCQEVFSLSNKKFLPALETLLSPERSVTIPDLRVFVNT
ncbi:MAG: hypothetical protein K2O11_10060, partial [Oscillospiraceae bacterium]|nr:hypothetical protein [Oscillospiraceae bacterium]